MNTQRPGTRPLSELDDVPWQSLTHAYGSAADVPAMISDLDATDEVGEAEHKLWSALLHQGGVYPATPDAIPFVFEVLSRSLEGQALLVGWFVDARWVFSKKAADEVIESVRSALIDAVGLVVEALGHPHHEVRSEVIGVLPALAPAYPTAVEELLTHLATESEDLVAADLFYSLAKLGLPLDEIEGHLDTYDAKDQEFIQSCMLCLRRELRNRNGDIADLVAMLPNQSSSRKTSPWWGIGSAPLLVELIAKHRGWSQDLAVLEKVAKTLADERFKDQPKLFGAVLSELFPNPDGVPRTAAGLNAQQRLFLEALSQKPELFSSKSGRMTVRHLCCRAFADRGLPDDASSLSDWLG